MRIFFFVSHACPHCYCSVGLISNRKHKSFKRKYWVGFPDIEVGAYGFEKPISSATDSTRLVRCLLQYGASLTENFTWCQNHSLIKYPTKIPNEEQCNQ